MVAAARPAAMVIATPRIAHGKPDPPPSTRRRPRQARGNEVVLQPRARDVPASHGLLGAEVALAGLHAG